MIVFGFLLLLIVATVSLNYHLIKLGQKYYEQKHKTLRGEK